MKASRLLLVACLSFAAAVAQAQPVKGSVLLGGNVGFSSVSVGDLGYTSFILSPVAGFFVTDRLAVGGEVSVQVLGGDAEGSTIGASPLVRYYFNGNGSARFFGQGNFNWQSQDFGEGFDAQTGIGFGLGAGLDYFFNEHVALEVFLGYDNLKYEDADDAISTIGLSIGVAAFIGGGGGN